MKPIYAISANAEKLNTAIAAAEGRATARTISAENIFDALEVIEGKLSIPKTHMIGITVDVDIHAQHFPSAYRYRPESTHFTAERTSSGWKVTSIYRGTTNSPSNRYYVKLTDKAKKSIVESRTHFYD